MKSTLIFYLILFSFGCQPNRSIELHEDEIVIARFNESEVSYLTSILDYVDSEIRRLSTNQTLLADDYQYFFNVLKSQAETEPYGELAKFDLINLKQILAEIPESFTNEIWYKHSEETGYEAGLHPAGKFARFVEEAAKSNPYLNEYADALKAAGDISPFMYASILAEPERLTLRLDRERLILAIHYVTIIQKTDSNKIQLTR